MKKTVMFMACALLFSLVLTAFGCGETKETTAAPETEPTTETADTTAPETTDEEPETEEEEPPRAISDEGLYTTRELDPTPIPIYPVIYTIEDNSTISLTEDGYFYFSGEASEFQIVVDAGDEDIVHIVLDGIHVTNEGRPVIYVKNAGKAIVTTEMQSDVTVTGEFGEEPKAAVCSLQDITLSGTNRLYVTSPEACVSAEGKLKITGGKYFLKAGENALEAGELIAMCNGTVNVEEGRNGLYAADPEDPAAGNILLTGGTLNLTVTETAVYAASILETDAGSVTVSAKTGLDAAWLQLNGGEVLVTAEDTGVSSTKRAGGREALLEVNGGKLDVTAATPFSYDGDTVYNGGEIVVNGEAVEGIPFIHAIEALPESTP